MNEEEQVALNAVMNFLDSYARKDVEACMSAITVSMPIMLLGTNDNEVFKTLEELREAFKRDFAGMTNIRWGKQRNIHVVATPTISNVIIELPISFQAKEETVEVLFRYALTLIKEGGQWKICSGMTSVPFASGTYSFSQK